MKFQKLTINNIASIENAEINFDKEPLSNSGIFLITGKTGSGKSTILDCICLALYGTTPRLKNTNIQGATIDLDKEVGVNDSRVLMRRNTSECFVCLTFVGNDNNCYQAEWSCKRARGKIDGTLQSKARQLTNLTKNFTYSKDKEIEQEIKRIIGLDFEQFLRTVMLSQGEFTRFLNSKDNEKAEILEKLTGVDIYSKIGKKIYEIAKEKKEKRDLLQSTLSQFPQISQEELSEKQENLKLFDANYIKHKQNLDHEKAKAQWIETSLQLEKEYQTIITEYQKNQAILQGDDFKSREKKVQIWRNTTEVRYNISKQQRNNKTIQNIEQTLLQDGQRYQSFVAGYRYLEAEKIEKQTQLNQINAYLSTKKNQQETTLFLQNITWLKQLIENKKYFYEKIKKVIEKISQSKEIISQNKEKISQVLTPRFQAFALEVENAKKIYEKQKDSVDKFAKTLRQSLSVGDICPVCLQKIENSLPIEEELFATVSLLKENYETAKKNYDSIQQEINILLANTAAEEKIYNQEKEALEKDNSIQDCENKIAELCKQCGFNAEVIEQYDLQKEEETAKQTLEKFNESIRLNQEFLNLEKECGHIKNLLLNILKQKPEWKNQITQTVSKIDDLLPKVNSFYNDLIQKLSQLNVSKSENLELEKAIQDFLQSNQDFTREKLEVINTVEENKIQKIEKWIEIYKNQEISLKAKKENTEKRRENHKNNQPKIEENQTFEQIKENILDLEKQLKEISEQRGGLEKEIEVCQKNIKQREELNQQLKQAEEEFLKWDKLNNFIGDATGGKFRKIAQSYVLENLINSANYHLRSLTDRYKLRVKPASFVIELEDAYNGFTLRPATTISGGESFLVSLSLALALSDIGQNLSLDILFIDEGFGTLSKEVLQTAIETLGVLHKTLKKNVGIISHVEELQERIPVQIKVQQEGNTSSSKISIIDTIN
ncbi:MAG: AAA family ATPase [Bacteroidales bacterium]|nr:AAA family ATPase [Bacteroidales bacterium]